MKSLVLFLIGVALLPFSALGSAPLEASVEAVERAANVEYRAFVQAFERQRLAEIYDRASIELRKASTREAFMTLMSEQHRTTGPLQSCHPIMTQTTHTKIATVVRREERCVFQHVTLHQILSWQLVDGRLLLVRIDRSPNVGK